MIVRNQNLLPLLKLARRKVPLEELRRISRHSTELSQGYELTMKNLEFLLDQGLVKIEDQRLVVGELRPHSWLIDGLLDGDADVWAIADSFRGRERKFDPDLDLLASIGLEGELFVMETLRQEVPDYLQSQIKHVSLTDDTAGFDIQAPKNDAGDLCFLEVKTSSRPSRSFSFFLSRNEWKQSTRLQDWYLVLVSLSDSGCAMFGHLGSESISTYMPEDQHRDFHWQSTRGVLKRDDVFSGLPTNFIK